MKAIILSAGRGERLRPLTDILPKPMLLIDNKPVLEYAINLCKKHKIKDIAINTSYLPEKIKEYFGNGNKFGVNIKYSFEEKALGTSGALNNFKDFFNDTFLVFYGDNITDINLTEMLEFHKKNKSIATIAVREKPAEYNTQSLIITDEHGFVQKFIEKPSEETVKKLVSGSKLINSGIYLFEPSIFKYIPEGFSDFSYDIFPDLINRNEKISCFKMNKYYFREIGKIEKYEIAKKEIENKEVVFDYNNELKKAVFIDRDGVINENIYEVDGKIMAPATIEQVKILDKVKEGIKNLRELGFVIIVITNQPGIDFGYLRKEKLEEINNYLKKELGIDEIYYCPHHPNFSGECDCRKPKIGLITKACKDYSIDIKKSYMVGDSLSDIQTGLNAGVKKTFRIGAIREDIIEIQYKKGIHPDYTLKDLVQVSDKIKELES